MFLYVNETPPRREPADDARRNPAVPIWKETLNSSAFAEHSRCEHQLEEIHDEPYVNSDHLIQESVLKKLKLHLKDQMELIVARYQHGMMQQH